MPTMKEIVSFRATLEEKKALEETAKEAGCNGLSEYIRRRTYENPDDGLRDAILLILKYVRSIVAHQNLMMDLIPTTAEDRQPIIQEYCFALVEEENGGEERC